MDEARSRELLRGEQQHYHEDEVAVARDAIKHRARRVGAGEGDFFTEVEEAAYFLVAAVDAAPATAENKSGGDDALDEGSDDDALDEGGDDARAALAPEKKMSKAKKARALKTPEGAKAAGLTLVTDFFSVKRKPGRQKRSNDDASSNKRGRPAARTGLAEEEASGALLLPTQVRAAPAAKEKKSAAKRINWSKGEYLTRLGAAVKEWDDKSERCTVETSTRQFAMMVNIPNGTLNKYITDDKSKRLTIGASSGPKPLLSSGEGEFVVDVVRRRDRANDGMSNADIVDAISELKPDLSRRQAANAWARTVRPAHKDVLTGIVVAQATTTKRTAITVTQQWRWHQTVEFATNELRRRNTGLCAKTGKAFNEVIRHFILGGDETCLLACDGVVKIIGDSEKKKHEKTNQDSRNSITSYRVGSCFGDNGPTAFLMSGKKIRQGYTPKFLVEHGAARGSSIQMTKTGFMTEEAWVAIAPSQAAGIRAMAGIADNPEWWCLKIIDGFGPHTSSPVAMKIYADAKILLLKEEADSSHVNQSYDQEVARNDKRVGRACLELVRRNKTIGGGIVDQWGLVHVGLACVRECTPEIWQTSFRRVNLDPKTRLSFAAWCEKIGHYLQGGDLFKPMDSDDTYALLPAFWQGMLPAEKRKVIDTIDGHGDFTVECVKDLFAVCHIPLADMQHTRLCYEVAKKNPEHLDMTAPQAPAPSIAPEVAAALEAKKPVTHGLASFQLKPLGLKGNDLLKHMLLFKKRTTPTDAIFEPEGRLGLEISDAQKKIIAPTEQDLTCRELMKDAGGDGATLKLAKRKLDSLGDIKAHCGLANNPERMHKLQRAATLASSISHIKRSEAANNKQKKAEATVALHRVAPTALKKLKAKGGDVSKLTVSEIDALLAHYFAAAMPKGVKPVHIKALQNAITANPNTLLRDDAPDSPGESDSPDYDSNSNSSSSSNSSSDSDSDSESGTESEV
jgi:hypothetical protein